MNKLIPLILLSLLIGCKTLNDRIQVKPALANVDLNAAQDVNAVKAQFDAKLEKMFEKLSAQTGATGQVGAGNKAETIQAETVTQTKSTVNDSGLMATIFKYWYGIFVLIIGLMKWQGWRDEKRHEKEIERIEMEKKFYKERYLAVGIKQETELAELRRKHDEFVRGGKQYVRLAKKSVGKSEAVVQKAVV